jgi:hypothetical protein
VQSEKSRLETLESNGFTFGSAIGPATSNARIRSTEDLMMIDEALPSSATGIPSTVGGASGLQV